MLVGVKGCQRASQGLRKAIAEDDACLIGWQRAACSQNGTVVQVTNRHFVIVIQFGIADQWFPPASAIIERKERYAVRIEVDDWDRWKCQVFGVKTASHVGLEFSGRGWLAHQVREQTVLDTRSEGSSYRVVVWSQPRIVRAWHICSV